jgi:hypothetical protein
VVLESHGKSLADFFLILASVALRGASRVTSLLFDVRAPFPKISLEFLDKYFISICYGYGVNNIIPAGNIEHSIFIIRGQKVMVDSDLAFLYGVVVRIFNEAVKRNIKRFPSDFMFQLTKEEAEKLRSRSQIEIANCDLKLRWSAISPVCLHRIRCCNAFEYLAKRTRDISEH